VLRCNFEQKASFIRGLTVEDICFTYKDLVNLGRLPYSMSDQLDSQGQWPFLSMEGLHHHHASLLKSSIKQEACFGAWGRFAAQNQIIQIF
jgi:hypothetical protein